MDEQKVKEKIRILWIVLLAVVIVLLIFFWSSTMARDKQTFYVSYIGGDKGGVTLSKSGNYEDATTRLEYKNKCVLSPVSVLTDIPTEVDDLLKVEASGEDRFFVYSFYVKTTTDSPVTVKEQVILESSSKNADEALRVRIYKKGNIATYAKIGTDGVPEPGTKKFVSNEVIMEGNEVLYPNDGVEYIIVSWIDGDDPECVDDIAGGSVRFRMDFDLFS